MLPHSAIKVGKIYAILWALVGAKPLEVSYTLPQGPLGNVHAFCVSGCKVYLAYNQRLWVWYNGRWEDKLLLPVPLTALVEGGRDTLWGAYLQTLYRIDVAAQRIESYPLPALGHIHQMTWQQNKLILMGLAGAAEGNPSRGWVRLPDGWIGMQKDTLWRWHAGSLQGWVRGQLQRQIPLLTTPDEIVLFQGQFFLRSADKVYQWKGTWQEVAKGVRFFRLGEKALAWIGQGYAQVGSWRFEAPTIRDIAQNAEGVIFYLTEKALHIAYPMLRYEGLFPRPYTAFRRTQSGTWILWQGQEAYIPLLRRALSFPATILDVEEYQGQRLWATSMGIYNEKGEVLFKGRYIQSLSAWKDSLWIASGREFFLQRGKEVLRSWKVKKPIRALLAHAGGVWIYTSEVMYAGNGRSWRSYPIPSEPLMAFNGKWYLKKAEGWVLYDPIKRQAVEPYQFFPVAFDKPVAFEWGRVLFYEKPYLYFSSGRVRWVDTIKLPSVAVNFFLEGGQQKKDKRTLPVGTSLKLQAHMEICFLPQHGHVVYELGESGAQLLSSEGVQLYFPQAGRHILRAWGYHPWYGKIGYREWEIESIPPWYQRTFFQGLLVAVAIGLIGGVFLLWERHRRKEKAQLERLLRQQAEKLSQQQVQLLESERMASLGLMAANIAHEVNTPLGVILSTLNEVQHYLSVWVPELEKGQGSSDVEKVRALRAKYPFLTLAQAQWLAQRGYMFLSPFWEEVLQSARGWEKIQAAGALHEGLRQMRQAAQRLHERVQAIKAFARREEDLPLQPIEVVESLERVLDFYRPLMRLVKVEKNFPSAVPKVVAHPKRLEQVWANLIQNALQAMDYQGEMVIRVRVLDREVEVQFQDSGKGIPPHLWEKIFEPLFTTKPLGEGTGLGLPLSKQLVESFGGKLKLLHSEVGYTLFGVFLPISQEG
ncbi:MAG: sensor histidine kinase [Bacteroidia bacterium]